MTLQHKQPTFTFWHLSSTGIQRHTRQSMTSRSREFVVFLGAEKITKNKYWNRYHKNLVPKISIITRKKLVTDKLWYTHAIIIVFVIVDVILILKRISYIPASILISGQKRWKVRSFPPFSFPPIHSHAPSHSPPYTFNLTHRLLIYPHPVVQRPGHCYGWRCTIVCNCLSHTEIKHRDSLTHIF